MLGQWIDLSIERQTYRYEIERWSEGDQQAVRGRDRQLESKRENNRLKMVER